jgi:DNA-directed RNA polymerase I, II, and III subunit RPABC2
MSYFDDEDDKYIGNNDVEDIDDNSSTSSSNNSEKLEEEDELGVADNPEDYIEEIDGEEVDELDDVDDDDSLYGGGKVEEGEIEEGEVEDDDGEEEGQEDEIEVDNTLQLDLDPDEAKTQTKKSKIKKIPAKAIYKSDINTDNEEEEDEEDGELYLQKFDQAINQNYIVNFHPESVLQNYDEILAMIQVIRDDNGIIIDDLHKTIPYLTKYERARILGQRAKQINSGVQPFIKVPENVIDGYIIAEMELKEKRIPFIIRRPLPNGGSEYWSIKDLEDIQF